MKNKNVFLLALSTLILLIALAGCAKSEATKTLDNMNKNLDKFDNLITKIENSKGKAEAQAKNKKELAEITKEISIAQEAWFKQRSTATDAEKKRYNELFKQSTEIAKKAQALKKSM